MSDPELKFYTSKPGNCLYVATLDGKVVGTAGAQVECKGNTMNLARMSVKQGYQRLGIAKKLLEAIKRHTK